MGHGTQIVAALRELGGGTVDETTQGLFMERCYQHDAAQKHPPPTDYREYVKLQGQNAFLLPSLIRLV